jgi:hypothetical protein
MLVGAVHLYEEQLLDEPDCFMEEHGAIARRDTDQRRHEDEHNILREVELEKGVDEEQTKLIEELEEATIYSERVVDECHGAVI